MKKSFLYILMFLTAFLIGGCDAKAPEKADMHLDTSFAVQMGDICAEGLLIYTEAGEMYMDFSTPDELSGLSFSFRDSFTIGYRGLNAVTEAEYLPPTSVAQSVKNTLDSLLQAEPTLESCGNGRFTASGKTDSGCYRIYTDRSGRIKEIEIVGSDLKLYLNG